MEKCDRKHNKPRSIEQDNGENENINSYSEGTNCVMLAINRWLQWKRQTKDEVNETNYARHGLG